MSDCSTSAWSMPAKRRGPHPVICKGCAHDRGAMPRHTRLCYAMGYPKVVVGKRAAPNDTYGDACLWFRRKVR